MPSRPSRKRKLAELLRGVKTAGARVAKMKQFQAEMRAIDARNPFGKNQAQENDLFFEIATILPQKYEVKILKLMVELAIYEEIPCRKCGKKMKCKYLIDGEWESRGLLAVDVHIKI